MSRGIRDFGIIGPTGPKGPTHCPYCHKLYKPSVSIVTDLQTATERGGRVMTKDELTREINSCTSWHVICHDGNMIRIIAENEDTFMELPDDVEYLEDISVNWEALKTAKNRSLGNAYALLNLINDYVNTPVEQRNCAGDH